MPTSPIHPSIPSRRACDSCRTRKVKCNGESPCDTCLKTSGQCTFLAPIRPKGPAPKRRPTGSSDHGPPMAKRRRSSVTGGCPATGPYTNVPWTAEELLHREEASPYHISNQSSMGGYQNGHSTMDMNPYQHHHPTYDISPSQQDPIPPPPIRSIPTIPTLPLPQANPPAPLSPISQSYPQSPNSERNPFLSRHANDTSTGLALWKTPLEVPQDISPILILTLDTLIRPQLEIYFERISPMIPIYNRSEIFSRIDTPTYLQSEPFVCLILAMVALSLIHPLLPTEVPFRHTRAKQSKLLMDEVCRLRARWDFGGNPSVEGVVTSYHMFGALFELGQAAGARMRLREAMSTGEALKLGEPESMEGLDPIEMNRRMKLCWVLSITERAYALQRSGHLFFDGPIPQPPQGFVVDGTGDHLRLLSIVFSHIDLHMVHCHNAMCEPDTCSRLDRNRVISSLRALSGPAEQVFGDVRALHSLSEAQKADLLITWQWIRNRIWKIGFKHGFMVENAEPELAMEHIVEIASNCVAICQRLSLISMESHGTGFVEKLYDIVSIVTDLLQGSETSPGAWAVIQSEKWGETLQALSDFIGEHRAGIDFRGPIAGVKAFVNCVNLLLAPGGSDHLGL